MLAGHTLMKILATFLYKMFSTSLIVFIFALIPFALFLCIMVLELAVAVIQTYVLTILTCSYIKDALELHSDDSHKSNNPLSESRNLKTQSASWRYRSAMARQGGGLSFTGQRLYSTESTNNLQPCLRLGRQLAEHNAMDENTTATSQAEASIPMQSDPTGTSQSESGVGIIKPNIGLNPWTVTGLTDGDGSFYVTIAKSARNTVGWSVLISFQIVASINNANLLMLEEVKSYFSGLAAASVPTPTNPPAEQATAVKGRIKGAKAMGGGMVTPGSGSQSSADIGIISKHESDNTLRYTVNGLKNCKIIQKHFLNYPLLTYKLVYFQLWSSILEIMESGAHTTLEGLLRIVALKSHFKKGLSDTLKASFFPLLDTSDFTQTVKPSYNPNLYLLNIHWLSGFITADGHFGLNIRRSVKYKLGTSCEPVITISQDMISLITLEYIKTFIGVGSVVRNSVRGTEYVFCLTSVKNINLFLNKIEEAKARILGSKGLDYLDFCKGMELINKKEHLTQEGFNKIEALSQQMNKKRTNFNVPLAPR